MNRLPDHLIRCYIDGELSQEDLREVERMVSEDPALLARVEQQRELASHLKRALQGAMEPAPAELRARIEASLAGAPRGALRPRSAASGSYQLSRWLRGPQRINVFAVAACLMLVAGAVLVGIFGRPIDRFARQDPLTNVDILAKATDYISHEHDRCAHDMQSLRMKAIYTDPQEASIQLGALLQAPLSVPELSSCQYEFIGGGQCSVPGDPVSCHLIYQRRSTVDGDLRPFMSIFIEPNHGQFVVPRPSGKDFECLKPGDSHCCPGKQGCRPVRLMTDGRLCYFITACSANDLPQLEQVIKLQMGLSPISPHGR